MRVLKRTNGVQQFEKRKITRAMMMAFNEVAPGQIPDLETLTDFVVDLLPRNNEDVGVERIQDAIEKILMSQGYYTVAKAFILFRDKRTRLRMGRLTPDPSALAGYIHASKYARYIPELRRRETFGETVTRVESMHIRRFPNLTSEIVAAFDRVRAMEILPSMRSMQFGGVAIETNNARMYNCSFTLIDRIRVFQEIFWLLLSGCGVGYSVQWRHVDRLPALRSVSRRYVVHHRIADTIEGWSDALGALMSSAVAGVWVEFDYSAIRGEGEVLKTSGGRAPGHLPLRDMLERVRALLGTVGARQMRPIECHDLICMVAEAVLAGGIRRSSLISLFSPSDTEMFYAKVGSYPEYRAMANNSVALLRSEATKDVFDRAISLSTMNYGDPGFVFLDNPDWGTNPCGEIGIYPVADSGRTGFGFCNLVEVNVATVVDAADFLARCRMASFIATLQAAYTDFTYLEPESGEIAKRDALIGVGLMGIMDKPSIGLDPELLRLGRDAVVAANAAVAARIGINNASRCCCVKPGGTAPLEVGGVGSGIHAHHARRYFRRVTANPLELPAIAFRAANPHMVETKPNGDWVITFPIQVGSEAVVLRDLDAIRQIDNVLLVLGNWVGSGGHNVSCTISVADGEMDAVVAKIWESRMLLRSMTFAPLTLDKTFAYAPREAVATELDEIKWNHLIANYKAVSWDSVVEDGDGTERQLSVACSGGKCDI